MCNGIRRIKKDATIGSNFEESLLLFYNWESQNCSKESYELIVDKLIDKPELEMSFFQLYDRIVAMSQFGKGR